MPTTPKLRSGPTRSPIVKGTVSKFDPSVLSKAVAPFGLPPFSLPIPGVMPAPSTSFAPTPAPSPAALGFAGAQPDGAPDAATPSFASTFARTSPFDTSVPQAPVFNTAYPGAPPVPTLPTPPQYDEQGRQQSLDNLLRAAAFVPLLGGHFGTNFLGSAAQAGLSGIDSRQNEAFQRSLQQYGMKKQNAVEGYDMARQNYNDVVGGIDRQNRVAQEGFQNAGAVYNDTQRRNEAQYERTRQQLQDAEKKSDGDAEFNVKVLDELSHFPVEQQPDAIDYLVRTGTIKPDAFAKDPQTGEYIGPGSRQYASAKTPQDRLAVLFADLTKPGVLRVGSAGLELWRTAANRELRAMGEAEITPQQAMQLVGMSDVDKANIAHKAAQNTFLGTHGEVLDRGMTLRETLDPQKLKVQQDREQDYAQSIKNAKAWHAQTHLDNLERIGIARNAALARGVGGKGAADALAKGRATLDSMARYIETTTKGQLRDARDGSLMAGSEVDKTVVANYLALADQQLRPAGFKVVNGKVVPMSNPPGGGVSVQEVPPGVTPKTGTTSTGQTILNGIPSPALSGRVGPFGYFDPAFADSLGALITASKGKVAITDGFRDLPSQVATKEKKGALAATPGNSPHGFGIAADLKGDLAWAHTHAPDFGLSFPMDGKGGKKNEPWHIQGRKGSVAPTTPTPKSKPMSQMTPRELFRVMTGE